jgi:two-component system sensor histidine kinase AlgZ
MQNSTYKNQPWLTDFCETIRLFVAVVMIQILVIVYSLSFLSFTSDYFRQLSILSLLAQLTGLFHLIILCKFKKFFNYFRVIPGLGMLVILVVLITTAISQLVGWLDLQLSLNLFRNQNSINHLNIKLAVTALIICLALIRYFYIQDRWKLQVEVLSSSRLMALQSRIKPHFLFNTLNSIASLIGIDSQKAEQAIIDLSSLMRRTFVQQKKEVSLADELKFVNQFLSIEKLRLGERLDYSIDCDQKLYSKKIPVLSLQPLVENAIIHGIQPMENGGKIQISIFDKNKLLMIIVSNPFLQDSKKPVNGIALKNIEERLKLLYGTKSFMKITTNKQIFTIQLGIPK